MSRVCFRLGVALLLVVVAGLPADAQEGRLSRAVLGGGVGVAGGVVVTISAVVARARFQHEYLESANDLIHWQSLPMIAAPAAGAAFGFAGEEVLRASVLGSLAGIAAGSLVGASIGALLSTQPEAPWAGGVIGAGVGLATFGLVEGLRAWAENDGDSEPDTGRALTLGFRVPLR